MIGTTLGHFRIVEKLGAGGMGEVYRARDEKLQRDVALKVLSAEALPDQTARARLLQEARAASALNHAHICTIYEVGEANGQAFIVMERVEGRALKELIPAGGLPAEAVLRYGAQIADALAHAHERGIVHRDLKTLNVVVTPAGQVKVLDFGLAKRLSGSELDDATRSQKSLTEAGAIVGTLTYMAPEVLRGEPADARSDIWALGVVLHEMAAGQMPFRGQTGFELSSAILREPAAPLPPGVPSSLRAIIQRCLSKEPGQRYQHAGEIRAVLEAIEPAASSAAAPATQTAAAPPLPVARRAGRAWSWLAGATGLAGLLGVAFALNIGGLRGPRLGPASHTQIQSLAVLPLTNFSGDPAQEYFADGMTEELITDLAKIGALKVISRTSVMQYKGTRKTVPEIARELNVDGVIEGSVQRSGDRVKITAQLIQGPTDRHLWANSYERDLRDVLGLQGEVASAIAREIRVTLTPQEQTRIASARPVDPEAYNDYSQGRYFYNQRTPESYRKANDYFQRAINKDPNYAPAWALWADTLDDPALSPAENAERAHKGLQKALRLDDSLAEVHTVIGGEKMDQWDWAGAERELRRAIELNPNYAEAHHFYSHYLMAQGRVEESLSESRRAVDSDPLNLAMIAHLAWHYLFARQYDQAIAQCRRTLDLDPNYQLAHLFLAQAEEQKGEYAHAIAEIQKVFTLARGNERDLGALTGLGHAYALAGNKAEALRIIKRLLQVDKGPMAPYHLAILYLGLGNKERSLALLKKAVDAHAVPVFEPPNRNPIFDSLHSDPRFADLLRRVGLPPAD